MQKRKKDSYDNFVGRSKQINVFKYKFRNFEDPTLQEHKVSEI